MTAWDEIVGVPVDAWIAADTPEKFASLLARRDAGEFAPKPPPTPSVDCDSCVEVMSFGSHDPVGHVCSGACYREDRP